MKLFPNSLERKKYVDERLSKNFPDFKTGGYFFRKFIKENISADSVLLDAGCGSRGMVSEFKNQSHYIIGVDKDRYLLDRNDYVDKKILSDLEDIPLVDNSVDIVISEFVIEHLANPQKVFAEIYRILKPGGVFVFLTPNLYNPIMLFSRLMPLRAHNFLLKRLLKKDDQAHATFYRCNTYGKLTVLGKGAGFKNIIIKRAGNPEYLGFTKGLARFSIYLEKIIDKNILQVFKMYLVGYFRK